MTHTEFLATFGNKQEHLILDSSQEGKFQFCTHSKHLFSATPDTKHEKAYLFELLHVSKYDS